VTGSTAIPQQDGPTGHRPTDTTDPLLSGWGTSHTQGTRDLLLDTRPHASQKYGHAPSSERLLESPVGETNLLASNKAVPSCDEGPPRSRETTHTVSALLSRDRAARLTREAGVRFANEMEKMENKGDHTGGVFPVSLGNTEYIHQSLTWIKGNRYHLELARVVSLHDIPL